MDNGTLMFGEADPSVDPIDAFGRWLNEAQASEINDPNAMALASVDENGLPDVRMVLLKDFDRRGFVFYTNFESRKGEEILQNRKAALCMHWKSLRRQVRARGRVEIVSEAEADAYFASRPHGSRIGAWASLQSQLLDGRATLERRVAEVEERYGEAVPRPPHWSGFRIVPTEIEFWSDGAFRLHDRFRFVREAEDADWTVSRLYP